MFACLRLKNLTLQQVRTTHSKTTFEIVIKVQAFYFCLPRPDIAGSDDGRAGGTCGTREVVFHVHGGLNVLAELNHHDIGHGVPVLDTQKACISCPRK